MAYRSTPHSVTGRSPAKLLFNRQIRTNLPELSADMQLGAEPHDNAILLADAERREADRTLTDLGEHLKAQSKADQVVNYIRTRTIHCHGQEGEICCSEKNRKRAMQRVYFVKLWKQTQSGQWTTSDRAGQSLTNCLDKCLHLVRPFNFSPDPKDSDNKLCI